MNDAIGMIEREAGPSWERPNWPFAELDELNLGLDPTQATIEKFKAAVAEKAAAAGASPDEIRRAAEDSIRAMMLIRTYRVRGHLAADLDPLGLTRRDVPADLTPAYHNFGEADLDRPIWICGALGFEQATVRQIVQGAPGDLLRPHRLRIYAHQRGRGAALHPGPDRERRGHRPVHARGQAVDPDQGHPRRAVGEIPRQEICRDQALRARRRRRRGPGARSGDQIWRA